MHRKMGLQERAHVPSVTHSKTRCELVEGNVYCGDRHQGSADSVSKLVVERDVYLLCKINYSERGTIPTYMYM